MTFKLRESRSICPGRAMTSNRTKLNLVALICVTVTCFGLSESKPVTAYDPAETTTASMGVNPYGYFSLARYADQQLCYGPSGIGALTYAQIDDELGLSHCQLPPSADGSGTQQDPYRGSMWEQAWALTQPIGVLGSLALVDLGYNTVAVDWGWEQITRDANGNVAPNPFTFWPALGTSDSAVAQRETKFRNLIAALHNTCSPSGHCLKVGLYTRNEASFSVGGSCSGDNLGMLGHEDIDVQQFANYYRADYLEIDGPSVGAPCATGWQGSTPYDFPCEDLNISYVVDHYGSDYPPAKSMVIKLTTTDASWDALTWGGMGYIYSGGAGSGCPAGTLEYGTGNLHQGDFWPSLVANVWRNAYDESGSFGAHAGNNPTTDSVLSVIDKACATTTSCPIAGHSGPVSGSSGPGSYIDMDFLLTSGTNGFDYPNASQPENRYYLAEQEQRSQFGEQVLASSQLFVGGDLREIVGSPAGSACPYDQNQECFPTPAAGDGTSDANTILAFLGNSSAIAIDQDPRGDLARVVASGSGYDVRSKVLLAAGHRAVGILNRSSSSLSQVTVPFNILRRDDGTLGGGLHNVTTVTPVWATSFSGDRLGTPYSSYTCGSNSCTFHDVPAHALVLLTLTGISD